MTDDPFKNSTALSAWAARVLQRSGLDEVAGWRMLEYWAQVELYRAIEAGHGGGWKHVGNYEHPYHTELPRSGSKTNTKWVDLVFSDVGTVKPNSIVWIELKDLGRSAATVEKNAKGLGHDLAALWTMNPSRTKEIWLDPPPHAMDRGRLSEWNTYGPSIDGGEHFIGQIVLCHRGLEEAMNPMRLQELWLSAFRYRCKDRAPEDLPSIASADTEKFYVLALMAGLNE